MLILGLTLHTLGLGRVEELVLCTYTYTHTYSGLGGVEELVLHTNTHTYTSYSGLGRRVGAIGLY